MEKEAADAKTRSVSTERVDAQLWSLNDDACWKEKSNVKLVHFVRHGQGFHNVVPDVARATGCKFDDLEAWMHTHCGAALPALEDPPLTKIGRDDALRLQVSASHTAPELIVVSPLRRATQTMLIGFAEHIGRGQGRLPVLAEESCREQLCGALSDKRSSVTEFRAEYPQVGCASRCSMCSYCTAFPVYLNAVLCSSAGGLLAAE